MMQRILFSDSFIANGAGQMNDHPLLLLQPSHGVNQASKRLNHGLPFAPIPNHPSAKTIKI